MKLGFCFLTYEHIVRYDIWNQFFKEINNERYLVYIHPKKKRNYDIYTFPYHIIENIINTNSKTNINIVHATLQLLKESFEKDKDITHFLFLSQSCIPLYSFDILFDIITKFPYSVVSCIDHNQKNRYYSLSNTMKKYITYQSFVKQQPNMILTRDDVSLLLQKNLTNHFNYMECPDEHYFINVLINVFKKNIFKKQIVYCNTDLHKTQALVFLHIQNEHIDLIRKYGFLFMRKLNYSSKINIDYLFDSIKNKYSI